MIGVVMNFTIKFLVLIVITAGLSGCTYTVAGCEKYADTDEYYLYLAELGSEQAQYKLGLAAHEVGDMDEAIKWLERAAEPASGRSAAYLPPVGGRSYGSVLSYDTGRASDGHRDAQLLLARIYQDGLGVEKDLKKTEQYEKLAAKMRSNL